MFFLPAVSIAADAPSDFAGVAWGATPQKARSELASRGAREKRSTPTEIFFEGGTFAGREVTQWRLGFADAQFTRGLARLQTPKGEHERTFRALKQELNEKYGGGRDSQVGRRRPPHFVYGLGWRNSGAKPPPLHAEWEITSGFKPRTVEIQLWVEEGQVHIAYALQTPGAAAGKKGDL
jgi:hypothetical protein